jgi:hypothetical protein
VPQAQNVNAVETQVRKYACFSTLGNQGSAATAPCAPEECRADVARADGGSVQGVASPDSTHRGIVSATCNFVARTSGIAARLLLLALFLLLNVLKLLLPGTLSHILHSLVLHSFCSFAYCGICCDCSLVLAHLHFSG